MIHSRAITARPVVAVVDPYSTGAQLAPALRALGIRPVAVVSPGGPPAVSVADLRPDDFDAVWYADQVDPAGVLARLEAAWIVPGSEEGVELADRLSAALTPTRANVAGLAAARRHKGRAAEAMAVAGLAVAATISTADQETVAAWVVARNLGDSALVLKPPRSAAADGVVLVEPGGDWRSPFRQLRGARNALGVRDDEVVVQEYVRGEEYAVDTVSVDGRHIPVALFRYGKEFTRYLTVDVMPIDAPDLFALAARALDAVGLRYGAAHTEVIRGPDGPRVVELNARLHGGAAPVMSRLASGDSQLDRLVAVLAGGPLVAPAPATRPVRAVYLCAGHPRRAGPAQLRRAGPVPHGRGGGTADHRPAHHSRSGPAGT